MISAGRTDHSGITISFTRLSGTGNIPGPVRTGSNGSIASARKTPPDLVLMDINLEGEMDGVEAADELARQHVPVVYLTAYSNDQTLERAKITEPYGCLLKPIEERELQTTIEVAIYKHRAQEALRLAHDQLELRVAERTAELRSTNEALQRGRREARRLALARVREQVWRMQAQADIRNVAEAVWESLEALEIPFLQCGINIVEQGPERVVRCYDRVRDGVWRDLTRDDPRAAAAVLAYARAKGIVLLIENNVCQAQHRGKVLMHSPLEITEFLEHMGQADLGLLLDAGHLSVSARTMGFDETDAIERMRCVVRATHLHWNDGREDQHLPATTQGDRWEALLTVMTGRPVIVEARFQSGSDLRLHLEHLRSELVSA